MKTRSFFSALILFMLLSSFKDIPEQRHQIQFKVKLGSTSIGTLVVEQAVINEQTTYSLHSKVEVDLLFKVNVAEDIADVFERGQLVQSRHTRHVNKNMKVHNTLIWNAGTYTLQDKNHKSQKLYDPISATILSIYFTEPIDGQKIYSQSFQQVLTLIKVGQGRYKVDLPNGNTTFFQYRKNKLSTVQSNTDWGHIVFERVER